MLRMPFDIKWERKWLHLVRVIVYQIWEISCSCRVLMGSGSSRLLGSRDVKSNKPETIEVKLLT